MTESQVFIIEPPRISLLIKSCAVKSLYDGKIEIQI